jgi:hypothetical protein
LRASGTRLTIKWECRGINFTPALFEPRFFVPLVTVLLSGAALDGQQSVHFRSSSSDLVVLAGSVTDKTGGFVEGVGRERFIIYDEGKRQPITLFSNEDTPVSVGLLIDNSGSMRPKLGEVVAATIAFAKLSHPEDELFALAFSDHVQEALKDGRRRHRRARAGDVIPPPDGMTASDDAVMAGSTLDQLARAEGADRPERRRRQYESGHSRSGSRTRPALRRDNLYDWSLSGRRQGRQSGRVEIARTDDRRRALPARVAQPADARLPANRS